MHKFNVGDKVALNGEIVEQRPFGGYYLKTKEGSVLGIDERHLTLVEKAKPVIKVGDYVNLVDAITNAKKTVLIDFKVVDIIGNEAAITWNDESGLCCRIVDIDKLLEYIIN